MLGRNIENEGIGAYQKSQQSATLSIKLRRTTHSQQMGLQPYPAETQTSTACFISLCIFLYNLPCVFSYLLYVNKDDPTSNIIKDVIIHLQQNQITIFCFLLAIKFIVFSTLFLDFKMIREYKLNQILVSLASYIRKWLRCIVQIDLLFSIAFLVSETALSLFNFIVSAVIISISVLSLENYSNRKDLFFVGSLEFHMFVRIKIIVGSLASFVFGNFNATNLSFGGYLLTHSILAFATSFLYASQGFIVYRTPVLKWGQSISVAAYLSIPLVMVMGCFQHKDIPSLIINSLFLTSAISFYLYQHISRSKQRKMQENINLKSYFFCLLEVLSELRKKDDNRAFIQGLMSFSKDLHLQASKQQKAYQQEKRTQKDRKSLLDSYIKCKFQQLLQQNPTNINAIFHYAQYLYVELGNISYSLYWLNKIDQNYSQLSFGNKIKWTRLIHTIRRESHLLSQQMFGSSLDIERLIKAESIEAGLFKSTIELLYQKMEVWRLLDTVDIDLSQLRSKTEQIRKGIQQNQALWSSISTFVERSFTWKLHYCYYRTFLRNEHVSKKSFQELLGNLQAQENRQYQSTATSAYIFDVASCCVHTVIKEERVLITRGSKNSANVTGYSSAQLENVSLNLLVPSLLADKHDQAIIKMLKEGSSLSQKSIRFSQTYILNKLGYVVPVQKCYKQFVSLSGQLEFVCCLRKINKNESVFLCNEDFQIQGFTQECESRLSIHKNGKFIKYFNITSFIPKLANLQKILEEKQAMQMSSSVASSSQPSDGYHNSSFRFSKQGLIQSLKINLCFPQQPLQNYFVSSQMCSSEDKREKILKIAQQIANRPHRNIACQVQLNRYRNSFDIVYYQIKLTKTRHEKQLIEQQQHVIQSDAPHFSLYPSQSKLKISKISSRLNIYIKQKENEAPIVNVYLQYIKYLWILLFVSILTFSIFNLLLFEKQFSNMSVSISNIYVSSQISIVMSQLVNLYIANILNIPTAANISQTTDNFENFLKNPRMHQAFFQENINPPAMYYAASDSSQNGTGYNHIDFLYFIQSLFRTLSLPEQVRVDSNSYRQVMDFQFPSFNEFLNITNGNLSVEFIGYQDSLYSDYVTVFAIEMMLIAVVAVLILLFGCKFYSSMLEMMKVHCHFTPHDISKNIQHLKKVIVLFQDVQQIESEKSLAKTNLSMPSKRFLQSQVVQDHNAFNLNKKSKKIETGQQLQRHRMIYFAKAIGCLFVFTAICLSRNLFFMSLKDPAEYQMIVGQDFLTFIPTHYLTAQIVANSFQPTLVPAYSPEIYEPLLSNLYLLMNAPYQAPPQSEDPFTQLKNKFYFTDACLISAEVLAKNNITLEECQSVANNSFKGGLRQYSRYQYSLLQAILNSSYAPTLQQVQQYLRSIEIYNTINNFVGDTWVDNYNKLTASTSAKMETFTLIACLITILLILPFNLHFFGYLKGEYEFYKFFYATMMPQEIISGEKIIRSKLTEAKFL